MHRLVARLLLLFALVGNLVPPALAMNAAPAHACCVRKAAHPCHSGAIAVSIDHTLSAGTCCTRDCCRAVTVAQSARAQRHADLFRAQSVEYHVDQIPQAFIHSTALRSRSGRAPPVIS